MENISFQAVEERLRHATAAVEEGKYEAAAPAFGAAAAVCQDALIWLYCSQANALISADLYQEALKVIESPIRIAPQEARPWYLKGTALFKLSQRMPARKAFEKAASLENVRTLKMSYMDWASKCDEKPDDDDAEEIETLDVTTQSARTVPVKTAIKASAKAHGEANGSASVVQPPLPPKDNTSMKWYQSSSHVSIDVYAKNVVGEQSSVKFESTTLKVRLVRPDKPDYVLSKDLYAPIIVEGSTWSVSKFKVEIRMKKATAGSNWKALDKDAQVLSAALQASAESARRKEMQEGRDKEWKSLAEKELKDYKEDDSPMALFRTLYKDADEDMQRAMLKSYSESGGQVLSTNWDEVKKKKVVYEEKH
eukprot:GFKZ01013289.1.p1 GENE.GFKZ01013289.1~~GFKZ01013289.1.p1  ORF type:complete len:366 (-),score=82.08 GFKZ01013289.1:672-1769(-)